MTEAAALTASVRPLEESDYSLVAGWLMDPAINRFLYAEWRDREISDKLIALAANGKKNRMWLGLIDHKPYALVAVGGVEPKDGSGAAWYLRGSGVGRLPGAMTRCVALAMREAFRSLDLHSITASVQAGNIASMKLLEAVGFKRVGVMREAFQVDGCFVDRVVFDLLEPDLKAGASAAG